MHLAWLLCLALFCVPERVQAQAGAPGLDMPPLSSEYEAWLITIAPGEIYWQRFGHNAIWLREPSKGLDHTFNFGYFDFDQEAFLRRFVTGRMLYQSLAFPAYEEMLGYAREGRSVRAQRLDLSPREYERLRDHLLWHVQPANRDYLYDYYLDNCSTRIRDAIDLALDGELAAVTQSETGRMGFRDHTRRLTSMTWWYYLGLELGLGRPVDHVISRWDEMFIPAVVSLEMTAFERRDSARSLVTADHWVYDANQLAPPGQPPTVWPRYLLLSLFLLVGVWLGGRKWGAAPAFLSRAWLMFGAVTGGLICLLWGLTNHQVVGPNANLLLFNPMFLLALNRRWAKWAVGLVATCGAVAVVQWVWVGWQYNLDVLALGLPLNLAAAACLSRVVRSA